MHVEVILNGGVTLVISPQSPLEEEAIKQLMKQKNEIIQIRNGMSMLNKTLAAGIVIGQNITSNKSEEPAS